MDSVLKAVSLLLLAGIIHADGNSLNNTTYESFDECSLPYTDIGGRCLLVETISTGTWQDMKTFCEQLRGQLVKMDDANLLYEIVQYMYEKGIATDDYWLGGSDIEKEGHFVYLDGTPMKMGTPFWAVSYYDGASHQEPNNYRGTDEDCVTIRLELHHYLNDAPCDRKFRAICEQLF